MKDYLVYTDEGVLVLEAPNLETAYELANEWDLDFERIELPYIPGDSGPGNMQARRTFASRKRFFSSRFPFSFAELITAEPLALALMVGRTCRMIMAGKKRRRERQRRVKNWTKKR